MSRVHFNCILLLHPARPTLPTSAKSAQLVTPRIEDRGLFPPVSQERFSSTVLVQRITMHQVIESRLDTWAFKIGRVGCGSPAMHTVPYLRQGISLPALILFGVPHPGTRAASTGMAVNKFSSDGSVRNVECVSGLMANLDPSSDLDSPRFSRDLGSVPSSHFCLHSRKSTSCT